MSIPIDDETYDRGRHRRRKDVAQGNPGRPQSEYRGADPTPPPDPARFPDPVASWPDAHGSPAGQQRESRRHWWSRRRA